MSFSVTGGEVMSVELYVWFPKPLSGNIGHASMRVDGGLPGGEVYLSRWPGSLSAVLAGRGTNNFYMTDVNVEGGPPTVVRLNNLDETAIKASIRKVLTYNFYSFLALNCAQQVDLCLSEGLSGLGYALSYVPAVQAMTPWTLYAKAKAMAAAIG